MRGFSQYYDLCSYKVYINSIIVNNVSETFIREVKHRYVTYTVIIDDISYLVVHIFFFLDENK